MSSGYWAIAATSCSGNRSTFWCPIGRVPNTPACDNYLHGPRANARWGRVATCGRGGGTAPKSRSRSGLSRSGPREKTTSSSSIVVIVDISERKRIEERQRLLIGELNHRIQNLFAVVQSVALHSLGGNHPLVEAREMFIDRLQSLGRAYTMMTEQEWRGAPLRQILVAETSAFADRVSLSGLDLMVRQKAAQSFALLLHELTTNAVKYGALSVPAGRVAVRWNVDREQRPGLFILSWEETGGPVVTQPIRTGYGRRIIEDTMRRIGKHQIEYAESGLRYRMEAPVEKVGWVIEKKPPP